MRCDSAMRLGKLRPGLALRGMARQGKGYNVAVWRFIESPFRCESITR